MNLISQNNVMGMSPIQKRWKNPGSSNANAELSSEDDTYNHNSSETALDLGNSNTKQFDSSSNLINKLEGTRKNLLEVSNNSNAIRSFSKRQSSSAVKHVTKKVAQKVAKKIALSTLTNPVFWIVVIVIVMFVLILVVINGFQEDPVNSLNKYCGGGGCNDRFINFLQTR